MQYNNKCIDLFCSFHTHMHKNNISCNKLEIKLPTLTWRQNSIKFQQTNLQKKTNKTIKTKTKSNKQNRNSKVSGKCYHIKVLLLLPDLYKANELQSIISQLLNCTVLLNSKRLHYVEMCQKCLIILSWS